MFKEDGNVIHFAAPKGISHVPHPSSVSPLYHSLFFHPGSPRQSYPKVHIPANAASSSPRFRSFEHFRHLRYRRGQGTHRACPGYLESTWPRQPRIFAKISRELPELTEEGWRGRGKGGG